MPMLDTSEFPAQRRRRSAAALLAAAAALAFACLASMTSASAQQVVVMVNGEPITAVDVEQRSKFIRLSTHKAPSREDVINELIDEKLKVKEAKRWGIVISDKQVETTYAAMAGRMHATPQQLTQNLARDGVSAYTLKDKIRADTAWTELVRGRYQASLQLSEKEIDAVMDAKNPDEDVTAYDYVMRPILLIVPPGSSASFVENRRKEAEALRARFKSCREGIALARTLRDVAVRDTVTRSTSDLSPELRKMVDAIPLGQLSAPERTKLGIEMFALCEKHKSKSDTPGKRQARNAAYQKRFEQQSKIYLKRLRREALIERR
jgi:peptidyl-prolyl cis-trans isomerase SurA